MIVFNIFVHLQTKHSSIRSKKETLACKIVRFQEKTFRVTEHDVDQSVGEEIIDDHIFHAGLDGINRKPSSKIKKRSFPIKCGVWNI